MAINTSELATDYGHHFYISMTNSDQSLYKIFLSQNEIY